LTGNFARSLILRNRNFVPAVDGLESRQPMSGVPSTGMDASEWPDGTGVSGDWGPDTVDQALGQANAGVIDRDFAEWATGTAGSGDWGVDPANWDDSTGVSGDWGTDPAV
jgi:hypothetical protein